MEQLGVKGIFNAWRKFGVRGFAENLFLKIVSVLIFGRVERKLILAKSLENLPPETAGTGFVIRELRPSEMTGNAAAQFENHPGDFAAFGAFSPSGELAAEGWICFRTFGWFGADAFGGGYTSSPAMRIFSWIGRLRNIAGAACTRKFFSHGFANAPRADSSEPSSAWTASTVLRAKAFRGRDFVKSNLFSS